MFIVNHCYLNESLKVPVAWLWSQVRAGPPEPWDTRRWKPKSLSLLGKKPRGKSFMEMCNIFMCLFQILSEIRFRAQFVSPEPFGVLYWARPPHYCEEQCTWQTFQCFMRLQGPVSLCQTELSSTAKWLSSHSCDNIRASSLLIWSPHCASKQHSGLRRMRVER